MSNTTSNYLRGLHVATVFACAFPLAQLARGQDALRTAVQGDRAYATRTAEDYLPEEDQLHAGPVYFQAGISYGLEWNDNVYLQSENPEGDFIQRPAVNLLGVWPISDTSRLNFGAGIGYEYYLDHSDLSGLSITPNSEFAWDIEVKDFVFTVYDRFSYSQDVLSQGTISSGTGEFPRIENTGGLRVRWYPSRYVFEAGYGHYNFISVTSSGANNYGYLDRSAEQFFGRAGIRFAEETTVGMEVSSSLTDYQSSTQSDNVNVSVGPFTEWQVTETLNLSLRGGMVFYQFDPSDTRPASDDLSSYYAGIEANHELTDHIHHRLGLVRDVQQGLNQGSDYIERFTGSYSIGWGFHEDADLSADALYEHSNEPQGGVSQEYDRYGAGIALRVRPIDHVEASLGYHFTIRDSGVANSDYNQNMVTLNGSYAF